MISQIYDGDDLGAVYSKQHTHFRLWAPTAERVRICFYPSGHEGEASEIKDMHMDEGGTWVYAKSGDLHGVYYTYLITANDCEQETNDPYGKATGVNGIRSMVVDLKRTNPRGFEKDCGPKVKKWTDAVIYELSILDTTSDKSCGAKYPGKYLGLTERGTKTSGGTPTGLDHILELGVTHVQLMPSYDFGSIDEGKPEEPQYNWGYDPINYNVPEGSFSTDPFQGEVRIKEYKKMVQAFHKQGIGVIMDVVYNHTYDIANNCFQKCVPDYYYRTNEDGSYSNASGCGNEIASERPMVRKFIIDSLKYWVKEYHIDGFRFDLMGVLDIETMNQAAEELRKINPSIILYGEGWTGGASVLPDEQRALKSNLQQLQGIGAFSDDIRDYTKGHVFCQAGTGFVNGAQGFENQVRFSVVGASEHPEVNYTHFGGVPWAKAPTDTINYVSCHDNLTLWDKLRVSCPNADETQRLAMNRLAAAMVFTAQGIPFFLQGEEFARSKPIEGTKEVSENSYNLPFYTNVLRYDSIAEYKSLYEYYKGLIAFRKEHEALRLSTTEEVCKAVHFIEGLPANVVAFTIQIETENLFVIYNANPNDVEIELPEQAEWKLYVEKDKAAAEVIRTLSKKMSKIEVQGISCSVAVRYNNDI